MVDQVAVVTKTISGTGTVDFTDIGITETFEAALLFYSNAAADDTDKDTGLLGFGFVSVEGDGGGSLNAMSRQASMRSGQTSTAQARHSCYVLADRCVVSSDLGATEDVIAVFDSVQAGGVRLNFTTVGITIKVTAILFAGIGRSSIGTATALTSGSTHENVGSTAVGFFQPDLLIFGGADGSLAIGSADGTMQLGFATRSPFQQITSYVNLNLGVSTSDGDGFIRSDSCSSAFQGATRSQERMVISSIDSTGFNHDAIGAQHSALYLAIKWANFNDVKMALANIALSGSTGLKTFSDFGFTPDLVLGQSTLMTALDTDIDGPASAGYFVTGNRGSFAYSAREEEAQIISGGNPTNATSRQGPHAILTLDPSGSVAQQAEWAGGSGSSSFVLDFSTATSGYLTALGLKFGNVIDETERISESVSLISGTSMPIFVETERIQETADLYLGPVRVISETVAISDNLGGLLLADGLDPLGPDGGVFGSQAQSGEIFALSASQAFLGQGTAEAGAVFVLGAVDGDVQSQ